MISKLFVFAGYTYGPLLGLYAFGLFTKWDVKDKFIPIIAILSPILSYIISVNSLKWFGFEFGFFILILKFSYISQMTIYSGGGGHSRTH